MGTRPGLNVPLTANQLCREPLPPKLAQEQRGKPRRLAVARLTLGLRAPALALAALAAEAAEPLHRRSIQYHSFALLDVWNKVQSLDMNPAPQYRKSGETPWSVLNRGPWLRSFEQVTKRSVTVSHI